MSITKTAEATRAVLKQHKAEALAGQLTTDEVIALVKQVLPNARDEGIYNAIEAYGPVGEGDNQWLRRAERPQIPSWFYNPRTGESLD